MWEVCPLCKGTNRPEFKKEDGIDTTMMICPVCNGQRIINELTGKPPKPDSVTINSPVLTAPYVVHTPMTCQPPSVAPPKYEVGIQCGQPKTIELDIKSAGFVCD